MMDMDADMGGGHAPTSYAARIGAGYAGGMDQTWTTLAVRRVSTPRGRKDGWAWGTTLMIGGLAASALALDCEEDEEEMESHASRFLPKYPYGIPYIDDLA